MQLLHVLVGLGSPSHLIFLRRHVSQATTTLLRFFAFGSGGLAAASSAFAFEPAAAEDLESDVPFLLFFCDVAGAFEGEAARTAALCGDAAGIAELDATALLLKLALGVRAGELSYDILDRPFRIETSSKAACVSSSLLYDIAV